MEGVTDGDTITLSGVGRTRLIGVDTPEVHGGVECYGREASAYVKRLVPPGTPVRYRLGVERRDRYGRALAYVWLADGRMLNAALVEQGYAQPLTIPPNVDHAERFLAAARRARRAGRGLWADDACAGGDPPSPRTTDGDRDCGDFESQEQAQRFFEDEGGRPGRDPHRLDGDDDGVACEG